MIGAGYFAAHQADAWRRMAGIEMVAVADSVPGRAREFALRHGIPHHYESAESMLTVVHPDFVDIATRPESHAELTHVAASFGAHVICQKPMAPTLTESIAMCEACEAAGVRLMVHENWRWQPWYREARRILDAGTLGDLVKMSFDWRTADGNGAEPYPAQPYFRTMPRLMIYESLVHILDTFRFLGGEMEITACEIQRVNPVIAGEDWVEIQGRFANGASCSIHGDRQTGVTPSPVAMGTMLIEGQHGSLRLAEDGCLFLRLGGNAEIRLAFIPPVTGYKGDGVFATQQHLANCLRTGSLAESEGRSYLRTAQLVEAAYALASPP